MKSAILLVSVLVLNSVAFAETAVPLNAERRQAVASTFGEGSKAKERLQAYGAQIEQRLRGLVQSLVADQIREEKQPIPFDPKSLIEAIQANVLGDSQAEVPKEYKKAAKKVRGDSSVQAYLVIRDQLVKMADFKSDSPDFMSMAANVLELDRALQTDGEPTPFEDQRQQIVESLKTWKIKKSTKPEDEAADLYDAKSGKFYLPADLKELAARGTDLSTLEPLPGAQYRKKVNIHDVSVTDAFWGKSNPLFPGPIPFPAENKVYYKSMRRSQSKPKWNVTYKTADGTEAEGKVKISFETHAQPTAAALFTALGFYSDPSKHVSDLKMVIGDMTYDEFREEENSYYKNYKIEKYVKEVGKDSEGNYVIFHQALISPKFKDDFVRVGGWSYGEANGFREARAMQLFNIWIGNADLKEAENNKLLLSMDATGNPQLSHESTDMGFSFGYDFRETPGAFPWHVVEKTSDSEIKLKYATIHPTSWNDRVSYNDAKWMTRLIAQLSRQQITDAVHMGAWPTASVEQLLVEKLLSRRNDFVKAFGLEREFPEIKVNEKFSTKDGVVVNGELTKGIFDNDPVDFKANVFKESIPLMKSIRDAVVKAGSDAVSGISRVKINPVTIGLSQILVPEVRVNFDREVMPNPNPATEDERFIVKDHVELGFGLGVGIVFQGRAMYIRKYTLVYTKPSMQAAQYGNNFVYNLLLPYSAAVNQLPEKHILITEDYVEGGGLIKLEDPTLIIPIGAEGSLSRIQLGRTIVSTRHKPEIRLYKDTSMYNEIAAKIYAKILIAKLDFYSTAYDKGGVNRTAWIVDPSKLNPEQSEALDRAVAKGDFKPIMQFAASEKISDKFYEHVSNWSFFGLTSVKNTFRRDMLVRYNPGKEQLVDKLLQLQVESYRSKHWLLVGETRSRDVSLISKVSPKTHHVIDPAIRAKFVFADLQASTRELKNGYIPFIDEVTNKPGITGFNPTPLSSNGVWGVLTTTTEIDYGPEAIKALYRMDLNKFMAESRKVFLPTNLAAGTRTTAVVHDIEHARAAKDDPTRFSALVQAINDSVWSSWDAYDGRLLAIMHKLIGQKKLFVAALVTTDPDHENKLPGGVPVYVQTGAPPKGNGLSPVVFGEANAQELYEAF